MNPTAIEGTHGVLTICGIEPTGMFKFSSLWIL